MIWGRELKKFPDQKQIRCGGRDPDLALLSIPKIPIARIPYRTSTKGSKKRRSRRRENDIDRYDGEREGGWLSGIVRDIGRMSETERFSSLSPLNSVCVQENEAGASRWCPTRPASKFAEQALTGSGPCALARPPRGLLGTE
ncbi:hypothetical protein B296_00012918 [Ensete ventricosum]|uniref:Uncharacterized protein n=1 Tax=Ensete ventricosum TaxID=4639 RepID=A0A426ZPU4_ENSVE|nr:hypothetical protein B296_00012918 [Ensete ventricosum]